MKGRKSNTHGMPRPEFGFSVTELVVALAITLILTGMAVPYFLRAYHSYELSRAAGQVADMVRLTRYEAIRRNRPLLCVFQPDTQNPGATDGLMTDTSNARLGGVAAATVYLGTGGNLVDAGGVAGATALPAAANLGPTAPATVPAAGVTLQFDARGALATGNVTVFYLQSSAAPDAGTRAVILTPSGSMQIWAADAVGNWRQQR